MEQKKVSPNRAKKEKIVAKLSEKAVRAKGFVFTNYQGLTHIQIEKLKKAVKQQNADYVVAKNSLLKLALLNSKLEYRNSKQIQNSNDKNSKQLGVSDLGFRISDFQGPTATLFMYDDIVTPLKALSKMIKELNLPIIKLAIIEEKTLTSDDVIKIASLPPRDILVAQFIGMMKTPLYGLHRALNWNIQKFVMTLKAIETKKSATSNQPSVTGQRNNN